MENEEKSKLTLDRYYADYLEKKIDFGRHLWLAFILLTVINIVMFVADWGVTVLTAAVVPYNLVVYCKGLDNGFVEGAWPEIGGFTLIALIASALILGFFFLCWFLSRSRRSWMIAAVVLMCLDTVGLLLVASLVYQNLFINMVDIFIHVWMIWMMIKSLKYIRELKTFLEEEASKEFLAEYTRHY